MMSCSMKRNERVVDSDLALVEAFQLALYLWYISGIGLL